MQASNVHTAIIISACFVPSTCSFKLQISSVPPSTLSVCLEYSKLKDFALDKIRLHPAKMPSERYVKQEYEDSKLYKTVSNGNEI